jgi:hypothetical protein
MSKKSLFVFIKKHRLATRFVVAFTAIFVAFSSLLPVFVGNASAVGQLTQRSVALSSGIPSATGVTYSYSFTTATAGAIQSIKFVACTSASQTYSRDQSNLTTGCTAPTSMNINQGSQQGTNTFGNTTAFTRVTSTTGACAPANNVLCVQRTQAASESAGAKTVAWNTQTNPSTANTAFYIGIYTYSDTSFTGANALDSGTVASAVVQSLTVDARVAETLAFCVGATTVDDATTSVAGDCTTVGTGGSTVNIGTLDSSAVNVSPVTTNGGNSDNGVAMVRSNAANGTTVGYDAIQAGTGANHLGTLRISGATCSTPGNSNNDGCINAVGTSQHVLTAGTEEFGMTIAGTNCGSTSASSYSCTYPTSNNLVPQSNYVGDSTGYCASSASLGNDCNTGTGNGFAWDETGSSVTTIASSAGSSIKQIDDEALILKFAATSNIITPFGSYAVQADFVATPTY